MPEPSWTHRPNQPEPIREIDRPEAPPAPGVVEQAWTYMAQPAVAGGALAFVVLLLIVVRTLRGRRSLSPRR